MLPVPPRPNKPTEQQPTPPDASQGDSRPPTVEQLRASLEAPLPPGAPARGVLLMLASLALFIVYLSDNPTQTVLIFVGVLFIHELGHLVGMWLFGYRDIKLFFVPFMGAVITSRNDNAEPWQRAVVLLLGPLPGIVAGLSIYAAAQPAEGTFHYELAVVFVLLNAFNMLPLVPLDGGRVLEVLLLTRLPILGTIFRVAAAVALAWLASETGWVVCWILAGLMLVAAPIAYQLGVAASAFRAAHPDLPAEPNQMSDAQLQELIDTIHRMTPKMSADKYADWARMLHGQANTPRASPAQVVILLGLYVAGLVAVVLFFVTADTQS